MPDAARGAVRVQVEGILRETAVAMGTSVDDVRPGAYLGRDLGIDSLGLVTMAARLGAELGAELAEDLFEDALFKTVDDVVALCVEAVAGAPR